MATFHRVIPYRVAVSSRHQHILTPQGHASASSPAELTVAVMLECVCWSMAVLQLAMVSECSQFNQFTTRERGQDHAGYAM
jgi:hypothetical protein